MHESASSKAPFLVEAQVGTQQGLFEAFRWFDGHLNAHLQDGDWECWRWAGREPQAEVLAHLVKP